VDVFLEGDNKAFGKKSAEYIVDRLKGKGKIVILRGIPSSVDKDRYDAAMEVFNANKGIEVLSAQPAMWNQQKALEVMQSYLASYQKIDAVWASDDDMALGAEKAIKEAGRMSQMWILGGAGMKDIIKRVMDKDAIYPADVTYPPAMIAAGIDVAVAQLKDGNIAAAAGKSPEHLGITKEQLEEASKQQGQKKITIDVFPGDAGERLEVLLPGLGVLGGMEGPLLSRRTAVQVNKMLGERGSPPQLRRGGCAK
jgi:ribose transport system substrate-binding protein